MATVFRRTSPLGGLTADDVAKLLHLPTEESDPSSVAYVASVATSDHWPALPEQALHGLAGDVVRAIEPHSEADPAAILIQFLVAFGNMIGPGPHCIVENTRHGLNLFSVLVGESSKARKGTSWGNIRRVLESVDPLWATGRITSGLSSAEGLINEVRDIPETIDEIHHPADKRLMVVQDEFASVLRIMAREGNTLSPILRNAWDGGPLRTLVKNNPLRATGAHISLIGHITRTELLKYLSETESHNGFANRLLWVCVKRSKCLPEGGALSSISVDNLSHETANALKWAWQCPRKICRDDAARDGIMGGFRSGRYARRPAKETTFDYPNIDCRQWFKVGNLNPTGPGSYRVVSTSLIGIYLRVNVECYHLNLCFRRWVNGEAFDWGHCRVRTIFTPCRYGGSRVWFCCPTPGCGRRVALLYLASRRIACRKCLNLCYETQRERAGKRALHTARAIRLRLGGSMNLMVPFPQKPKGMHWRRYFKLLERLAKAEQAYFSHVGGQITSMERRYLRPNSDC